MPRSDLFLKVQIEHEAEERPQELAEEICRQLRKWHGVRTAEVSSVMTHGEPEAGEKS